MRRVLALALFLTATPALAGLFGGGPPTRIPVPARDFTAVVEDHGGVRVRLTRVTLNGEVSFYGDLGRAQVTVPFERVKEVRFRDPGNADGDLRVAVITTREGETVEVSVEHDTPLYGRATFGNYRIDAEDIRVVELLGPTG